MVIINEVSPSISLNTVARRKLDLNEKLLALTISNGYSIVQTNGQRVYAPSTGMKIPEPGKGCEIFIGKLHKNLYEDELIPLFESVGPLYKFRLMLDFSDKTRGYAFATYFTPDAANKAVKKLNNFEIRPNLHIGVFKSVDNCRLFIGNIPVTKTRQEISEILHKYVDGIVDVIMYQDVRAPHLNRGFVFLEFQNHRLAAMARRQFTPENLIVWGQPLYVDWADPVPEVDPHVMAKVKILFIRNLDVTLQKEDLEAMLQYHIQKEFITKVYKFKNYAFVHLTSRSAAETLLKKLEDFYRDSGVEVTWAKPQNKFTSPEYRQNKVASSVHKSPRLRTTSCSSSVGSTSCTSSQEYIPRARCVSVPPSMNCKMVGLSNSYYPTTSLNPILLPSTSYASTSQQCTPQVRSSIFNWEWDNTLNAPSLVDDSFRNLIPFNEAQPFYNVNDLLGIADLDTQVNSQTRDTVLQILKNLDISGL